MTHPGLQNTKMNEEDRLPSSASHPEIFGAGHRLASHFPVKSKQMHPARFGMVRKRPCQPSKNVLT
jgi:hypothetical protein